MSFAGILWWFSHEVFETAMGVQLMGDPPLGTLGSWLLILVLGGIWTAATWRSAKSAWGAHTALVLGALLCFVIAPLHFALAINRTRWIGIVPWMTSPEAAAAAWVPWYNALVYVGSGVGLAILVSGGANLAVLGHPLAARLEAAVLGGFVLLAGVIPAATGAVFVVGDITVRSRDLWPWLGGFGCVIVLAITVGAEIGRDAPVRLARSPSGNDHT